MGKQKVTRIQISTKNKPDAITVERRLSKTQIIRTLQDGGTTP